MSGWQLTPDAAEAYAKYAWVSMGPWIPDLIGLANFQNHERVLDLACGTGLASSRIKEFSGADCRITGVDINDAMLALARQNTGIEWHKADATNLPFPDGSFDVVICQQGFQYFSDRQKAMNEVARVLTPGGRVAVAVWGPIERQALQREIFTVVCDMLGEDALDHLKPAYSLNSISELHELAETGGLKNPHVRIRHKTLRFADPAEFIAAFMQRSPIASLYQAMIEEKQRAYVDAVLGRIQGWIDDDGLAAVVENRFFTAAR